MRNGAQVNRFIYASHLDLSTVQATTDVIEDFRSAERDLIDLAAMDANPGLAADQAFQFVGTAGLTAIGQVAYRTIGTDLLVEINLAGDAAADAVIVLRNVAALTAADFIL